MPSTTLNKTRKPMTSAKRTLREGVDDYLEQIDDQIERLQCEADETYQNWYLDYLQEEIDHARSCVLHGVNPVDGEPLTRSQQKWRIEHLEPSTTPGELSDVHLRWANEDDMTTQSINGTPYDLPIGIRYMPPYDDNGTRPQRGAFSSVG